MRVSTKKSVEKGLFISAIQKITIKDAVLYKDKKLKLLKR